MSIIHPPLECCGQDVCPYDYCADDPTCNGNDDEVLEDYDDLEEALNYCLDRAFGPVRYE